MFKPTFEFFEIVCGELDSRQRCVLTPQDLSDLAEEEDDPDVEDIIDALREEHAASTSQIAISRAVEHLKKHFSARGSALPFQYNEKRSSFSRIDTEFIRFVARGREIRGGTDESAREFEVLTTQRLKKRLTGPLHRVGWKRTLHTRPPQFLKYLKQFGFDDRVVYGQEKDAGLDIVWLPPLGAVPIRPIVSLQCKNGWFDRDVGRTAFSRMNETVGCHTHMAGSGLHLSCVIFNDYIEPDDIGTKPCSFMPLGISDLASLRSPRTPVEVL